MLDSKSFSCIQSFVFSIDAPDLTLRNTYGIAGGSGGKQKREKEMKSSKATAVTDTTS